MTTRFKDIIASVLAPGGAESLYWRERTLKILLVAGLSMGLPAIVSSLFLIVQERLWGLLILDVTMFLSCFTMLLLRRLRYGFRAAVGTFMMYGLGLSIICYLGPVIGGLVWLFSFAVMAGALLGVRAALAALTLNGLTLAVVWLVTTTGRFGASPVAGQSVALDVANGANFLFMNAVAAIAVALLVRKLDSTILKEIETSEKLERERRELVKTNVQLNREVDVRKSTEIALRRSEETYRLLADNVHDNIWVLSLPDLKFTYVSPSVEMILGYTVEEAEALSLEDILTPASLELTMNVINQEMTDDSRGRSQNGSPTLELEEYRKDGTTVWVEVATTFVRDASGRLKELIGVTRDITQRKEAEAALKESQEQYHSILESSPDPVVQYDNEGRVIYVNPAFTRVFGWTLGELVGQQIEFVPSEARSENRQRVEQIKRGESFYGFETRRYNKAGRVLDISLSAAVWRDREGTPAGSVITLRDITEQKRMEDQLQHARKMEAVGTLAGGVAHDFNNTLQAISGYVQLLLMKKEAEDPDHEYLFAIDQAIRRATGLINQLLTVSRKMESKPEPVDLGQVVAEVSKLLERTIPRMIRIEIDSAGDLRPVNADPTQLEQIILNLGGNARDAMPDGGQLTFRTRNLTVGEGPARPHAEIEPGEYVVLEVSDTGHGMDEETVHHIFEPFFTTKGIGRGTGLGLATVYGIVRNHGGHITCDSRVGRGTTFTIFLPALAEAGRLEYGAPEDVEDIRGGQETILLVDDERPILDIGEEILGQYGYSILTASSGEEALEIYECEGQRIDLVILDLSMPGMGGHRCLKELRVMDPGVRVIIATGYSARSLFDKTVQSEIQGFINKPYSLFGLLKLVREVLDAV